MIQSTLQLHDTLDPAVVALAASLSVTRSPEAVRQLVRDLLSAKQPCQLHHLRARGVEGGNGELNDLIRNVKAEHRAQDDAARAGRVGEVGAGVLPPEYLRVEEQLRSATLALVARLKAQGHHLTTLRLASVEQEASALEEELRRDLAIAEEQVATMAGDLDERHREADAGVLTIQKLESRIEEQTQQLTVMRQSIEDLRSAVRDANETLTASAAEQSFLRARAERAEDAVQHQTSQVRALAEQLRVQATKLQSCRTAVVARTQEAMTLQRVLDTLVASHEALVARNEPATTPASSTAKPRRAARSSMTTTASA